MASAIRTDVMVALACLALAPAAQAQHSAMPPGMTHEQHMAQMNADGQLAMGFDQDTTTHHFLLAADGGSIAVDVKVADDQVGRNQIRAHLKEIAIAFKRGDFGKPLMTHSEQPPGVDVLQRLRDDVSYTYADTAAGGIVRIQTANPAVLAAVHNFLTYQIREHATGDPLTVQGARP